MVKNILIVVLVISNVVFLVFGIYQRDLAGAESLRAEIQQARCITAENNALRMMKESELMIAADRRRCDSLQIELQKVLK
jgi:hypothetical protein